MGKRGDGAGRVTADPGDLLQLRQRARELAVADIDQVTSRFLQIAGSRVVAPSLPSGHHPILWCLSQCFQSGEGLHPALKIGNHSRNLGLLQHHFGDQYPVRGRCLLPGQIVTTVACLPSQ